MIVEGVEYPIRMKPRWVNPLPWIGSKTCQAFFGKIWVPHWVYEDLQTAHPTPWSIAIVLHEQEHLKEYKKHGPNKHFLLYVFSRTFRLQAELIACKPQMAYLKSKGIEFHFDVKARALSGWLYVWCTDYENANTLLRECWDVI